MHVTSRPNVLLLVVDSLRYDIVYGDWPSETPTFDRLADEGHAFHRCISQGISTAPAMTALLTGRLPLDPPGHWGLGSDEATLASVLGDVGYATGAVHSNPYVSSRRGFDRGFDVFVEGMTPFEPDRRLAGTLEVVRRMQNRVERVTRRRPYMPGARVNEHVDDVIAGADGPWFCWGHYMDPHGPYLPGEDASYLDKVRAERLWRKAAVRDPAGVTDEEHETLREDYRMEVEYVDSVIGELFAELDVADALDETIVVVTADHGDAFAEHGRYGHGGLPYGEVVHVPLVVCLPAGMEDTLAGECDALVRSVDIVPTIYDLLEIDLDAALADRLAGRSLCEAAPREVAVTEKRLRGTDEYHLGVRTDEWTYIYESDGERVQLFNVEDDPGETHNVIDVGIPPGISEHVEERREVIDRTVALASPASVDVQTGDPLVEERLRALGYRE